MNQGSCWGEAPQLVQHRLPSGLVDSQCQEIPACMHTSTSNIKCVCVTLLLYICRVCLREPCHVITVSIQFVICCSNYYHCTCAEPILPGQLKMAGTLERSKRVHTACDEESCSNTDTECIWLS